MKEDLEISTYKFVSERQLASLFANAKWPEERRKQWRVVRNCDEKWQPVSEILTRGGRRNTNVLNPAARDHSLCWWAQLSLSWHCHSIPFQELQPAQDRSLWSPDCFNSQQILLHHHLIYYSTTALSWFCPCSLRSCSRGKRKCRKCWS